MCVCYMHGHGVGGYTVKGIVRRMHNDKSAIGCTQGYLFHAIGKVSCSDGDDLWTLHACTIYTSKEPALFCIEARAALRTAP